MTRRDFATTLTTLALRTTASPAQTGSRFIKGICAVSFPPKMPYAERCREAKAAGFDAIELSMTEQLPLTSTPDEVKRLGDDAKKAGVQIASLWVSPPLAKYPLNSPDAAVRAKGVDAIRTAVEFAGYLDCGALLLVPGRVGAGPRFEVGYETTWKLFTEELKKAIPFAERAKVILTIENVGNRFLVSPLEMRAFVDQFASPWLQAHFDIGNFMFFSYPQDWILTLGSRIKRIHVKDRKASPQAEVQRPSNLLEGDVDWKAVMAALVKVNYRGFMTPEIGHDPSDPAQLAKISAALDKILAMA